jgi:DNA repair exonuclease SbcCD ATPase subunit
VSTTPGEQPDELGEAYEQRTNQLHEARGALAEAVATLTAELRVRREEAEAIRRDNRALHEQAEMHVQLIQDLQRRNHQLEGDLRKPFPRLRTMLRSLRARRG